MPLVTAYYRPDSLHEALSLLAEPNRVPLAGGTVVNAASQPAGTEVVDLQALGLGGIGRQGDVVTLGATTTLADLAADGAVPSWLRSIARAESPSTLRTLATVGGTVAGRWWESLLLAAFLVCDGSVRLAGADDRPLVDIVDNGVPPGALITAIDLDVAGSGARATTARTPADVPIIGAVARRSGERWTVALSGVGETPVLVDPAEPTAGLDPPDDFRGSTAYRLRLAGLLSSRAQAAADQAQEEQR